MIQVEVAYARADIQRILSILIEADSTVAMAIERSGILLLFPEIDLTKQPVGIFSQCCQLTDHLKEGDRIEIYRPLSKHPMEARRQRAKSAKKKK
jgi:hypothetical protein